MVPNAELSPFEQRLLGDLFAIVEEHASQAVPVDRERVEAAFAYACMHHADQRRLSGEEFIIHPVGVAKICAGMRLDTETLCAALLHDTVEDTSASLEEVAETFGEEISGLVDGVTKLDGLTFQSRDEAQAENYRKMVVAMATDIRVILIKLADRLHNMRTISAMSKQKQLEKSRETLDIYAPIAHRLGIHAIKWELEDLAFQTLHPRKYNEIKGLVAQQRGERERYVSEAGEIVAKELAELGIHADISGRAKHFYSIYAKMTKKGREFNEIYDLTAMRVIVDSVKDCYGAVGVIHSLWKPLPGRFKDFVAMPKFNMYSSLHTTVIGPEGRPLEIQIRTREMHDLAEFGIAAHWMYKEGAPGRTGTRAVRSDSDSKLKWLRSLMDWQQDMADPREFMENLKVDLFEDEVFLFTPKGEVKSLAAGSTPLDFAYEIHTDVGHRCVGAKVNGKIVPLSYQLRSGDIVEVLTSKRERGPSRDWLALVKTTRARNKIKAWFKAESRRDTEHSGRELLQDALRKQGLPAQKLVGSPLLADVIREMGFKKGDDFYIALGAPRSRPTRSSTRSCSASSRARPPSPSPPPPTTSSRPAAAAPGPPPPPRATASPWRGSTRSCCAWPSAAGRCRAIRSWATSRSAAGSPSTARTAPTWPCSRRTRSASPPCPGTATPRPRSASRSRSTAGIATASWRTCRGPSRRPASTSSTPTAPSTTRWSRTGSWSRWGTPARSIRRSTACATSTRSSTPTASPPARGSRFALGRPVPAGGRPWDVLAGYRRTSTAGYRRRHERPRRDLGRTW